MLLVAKLLLERLSFTVEARHELTHSETGQGRAQSSAIDSDKLPITELSRTVPAGYPEFLADLKQRIRQAQLRASLGVNRELVLLYWRMGKDILERQEREHWGAKVIDRLAADLKQAFPEMKGFSPRNLKYMRAFAEAWPEVFVQQATAQIRGSIIVFCWTRLRNPPRASGT